MASILIKFGTVDFTANAVAWRESVPKRVNPVTIPNVHGARITETPTYEPRQVQIDIHVTAVDLTTARDNFDSIVGAFPTGEANLYRHSDRYVKARFAGIQEFSFADGGAGTVINATLAFFCADPFYYDDAGSTTASQTVTASPQSWSVTNSGKEIIFPKIQFTPTGGTITSLTLRNNTLSPTRAFDFQGTVSAGNTLVADFPNLRITNSGTDDLTNWKTASGSASDMLWLVNGANSLTMTWAGTATSILVEVIFTARWV